MEQLIRELAAQLGMTVQYAYGVLSSFYRVQGIVYVIQALLCTTLMVGSAIFTWHRVGTHTEYGGTRDVFPNVIASMVAGVFVALIGFVFLSAMGEGVLKIAVPEYYALDALLKVLCGGK